VNAAKGSQVSEELKTIQLFLVLQKKLTDTKNLNTVRLHVSPPRFPSFIPVGSSEKIHLLHEPCVSMGTVNK